MLGYDSVKAFNDFTPLTGLVKAAESGDIPERSRAGVAVSAWTRAFLLGDDAKANQLTQAVARAHASWAPELEAFRAASGDEKRFAGALLIERHSDFHLNVWLGFAPAWWCAPATPGDADSKLPEEAFPASERMKAKEELQRLAATGPAQEFLGSIVMRWARAHPRDARVPEALHRLVRVTRYGCGGFADNGRLSKAAFDLLHEQYQGSEWARRTPYWFDR